jgi:hypothetical protein
MYFCKHLVFVVQPPRSPDLSPLNFCLCGHLKTLVYLAPTENKAALHRRIIYACQIILNSRGKFESVRQSMIRRVHPCTDSGGGHFWRLL